MKPRASQRLVQSILIFILAVLMTAGRCTPVRSVARHVEPPPRVRPAETPAPRGARESPEATPQPLNHALDERRDFAPPIADILQQLANEIPNTFLDSVSQNCPENSESCQRHLESFGKADSFISNGDGAYFEFFRRIRRQLPNEYLDTIIIGSLDINNASTDMELANAIWTSFSFIATERAILSPDFIINQSWDFWTEEIYFYKYENPELCGRDILYDDDLDVRDLFFDETLDDNLLHFTQILRFGKNQNVIIPSINDVDSAYNFIQEELRERYGDIIYEYASDSNSRTIEATKICDIEAFFGNTLLRFEDRFRAFLIRGFYAERIDEYVAYYVIEP